jgi:hypothetical protein
MDIPISPELLSRLNTLADFLGANYTGAGRGHFGRCALPAALFLRAALARRANFNAVYGTYRHWQN